MDAAWKHLDCLNFAAVDVSKGICHRTKELIPADGPACEEFSKRAKCKHCRHYRPGPEALLGTCAAVPARPFTYPDLMATTCEHYEI